MFIPHPSLILLSRSQRSNLLLPSPIPPSSSQRSKLLFQTERDLPDVRLGHLVAWYRLLVSALSRTHVVIGLPAFSWEIIRRVSRAFRCQLQQIPGTLAADKRRVTYRAPLLRGWPFLSLLSTTDLLVARAQKSGRTANCRSLRVEGEFS